MNNPKLTQVIKELAKNLIKEEYQDKYKIIGLLTTNLDSHSQTDIYSDIRSITGITVISSKEPMAYSEQNLSQFKSILTVKIDGYPFMKRGGFSRENIQAIINEIKKVDGVVSFIVNPNQITPIR
jgi:predicted glycoside hydrolase/deacetylase ChbG (UPF0249 family)